MYNRMITLTDEMRYLLLSSAATGEWALTGIKRLPSIRTMQVTTHEDGEEYRIAIYTYAMSYRGECSAKQQNRLYNRETVVVKNVLVLACTLEAAHFALVGGSFTLAPGLGTLVMRASTGLGQNASLLNFAVKLFQCNLKCIAGVDLYFTHSDHQRDLLRLPERPAP